MSGQRFLYDIGYIRCHWHTVMVCKPGLRPLYVKEDVEETERILLDVPETIIIQSIKIYTHSIYYSDSRNKTRICNLIRAHLQFVSTMKHRFSVKRGV